MLRNSFHRFVRRADGTSTLELAFILPVIIFVLLYGGFEIWAMISTALRVDRTASHVAGVASRADATLDEGAVTSLLASTDTIAAPTPFLLKGRVILSAVEGGPAGKILWQRCKGTDTTYESAVGLTGDVASLSANGFPEPPKDTTALIAETFYLFEPSLVPTGLPGLTLSHKAISLGREEIPDVVVANGLASAC
jgi:Flp pilus assembly protein TadG